MTTGNSCNFPLGTIGQVLTMITANKMAFQNISNRSQSSPSRSFNTVFQISTNQDSFVMYTVDISCTLSLTGGQTGTIFLEMATNSSFTTGVQQLSEFVNGNTGTLTVGLNITQNISSVLCGYIPAGNYVRIRTANTSGTPSFSILAIQEILL